MTDYTVTTDFSAKDALASGDSNKLVAGAPVDTEFANIATATATKFDAAGVGRATELEVEAETLNTVWVSPLRLAQWSDDNGGMIGDIQALADPDADTLLGWDDSASAAISFSIGAGLATSTTTIALSHLGFQDLADPGADRIVAWDDSESKLDWLTVSNGVTLDVGTQLSLTDVTAGVAQPVNITNGTFTFEMATTTEIAASGITQSADKIVISDAGTIKVMPWDQMGSPVQSGQGTQTLALTDMNTIMEFTATATLTIPTNASVALEVGAGILLQMSHATQVLTITAASGVTLSSIFHPAGVDNASDTVVAGGSAVLYKKATNAWCLSGDITT